jgi:15-cis-phytoene synthase
MFVAAMNTASISDLVGSSVYAAIADDSLKDEDNAAWVMFLEPEEKKAWIERIGWIRLIDRLAEQDLLAPERSEFQKFRDSWHELMRTGIVSVGSPHQSLLFEMQEAWFNQPCDTACQLSIHSWDRYLQALDRYHSKNLVLETFQDFETMLEEIAASFFQVLPFLSAHQWQIAGQFGVVDQFYNILRDLLEDAEQGICYLPMELLDRFGVSRSEILQLTATANPQYAEMMQFWVYDYLPQLYCKAYPLILASDLAPSWERLRDWSVDRYKRIERVFRVCHYDYLEFPKLYWREVQRELALPEKCLDAVKKSLSSVLSCLPHPDQTKCG